MLTGEAIGLLIAGLFVVMIIAPFVVFTIRFCIDLWRY